LCADAAILHHCQLGWTGQTQPQVCTTQDHPDFVLNDFCTVPAIVKTGTADAPHVHATVDATNPPDQMAIPLHRHKVQQLHRPFPGTEGGFQQQCFWNVGSLDAYTIALEWTDLPETVAIIAQQPGEAGRRIESAGAEPVDR